MNERITGIVSIVCLNIDGTYVTALLFLLTQYIYIYIYMVP